MEHEPLPQRPSFWKSPLGVVCTLIALGASAYLWLVHQDHVLALVPYLFLAACPLMHMFMHKGHHGHHHGGSGQGDERASRDR